MRAIDLLCRRARMADADLLWWWANDPETRQNSFNKSPIAYHEHLAWLGRQFMSMPPSIWIFSDGDSPVGQVRFELSGQVAEIHLSVAPECRGRSYGKAMLRRAIRLLREEKGADVRLRASVLDHNLSSLRLFKACGFQEVGVVRRAEGERAIILELIDELIDDNSPQAPV